jgi:predicted DsbA family dithiol-disulfide isomerase
MKRLSIDVWSDIACPWCYVGKRRLEAALREFPHSGSTAVAWHAFELDPRAPRERDASVSHAERIAKKYGMSVAQAEERTAHLTRVAAAEGLAFHFERIRSGNTFDAHRVVQFGASRELGDAVKERFLLGYFTDGEPIGDPAALVRMAAEAGLPADEVRQVVEGDAYAEHVRRDEADAAEIGIRGVPFFVFAQRYAVSGAQPKELLLSALDRAWNELEAGTPDVDEGAVCGPEGC